MAAYCSPAHANCTFHRPRSWLSVQLSPQDLFETESDSFTISASPGAGSQSGNDDLNLQLGDIVWLTGRVEGDGDSLAQLTVSPSKATGSIILTDKSYSLSTDDQGIISLRPASSGMADPEQEHGVGTAAYQHDHDAPLTDEAQGTGGWQDGRSRRAAESPPPLGQETTVRCAIFVDADKSFYEHWGVGDTVVRPPHCSGWDRPSRCPLLCLARENWASRY